MFEILRSVLNEIMKYLLGWNRAHGCLKTTRFGMPEWELLLKLTIGRSEERWQDGRRKEGYNGRSKEEVDLMWDEFALKLEKNNDWKMNMHCKMGFFNFQVRNSFKYIGGWMEFRRIERMKEGSVVIDGIFRHGMKERSTRVGVKATQCSPVYTFIVFKRLD